MLAIVAGEMFQVQTFMPKLSKRTLSAYFKSDCERRLALDLFNAGGVADKVLRTKYGMPERQPTRPGFDLVARAGDAWQYEKVQDLVHSFGKDRVHWLPAPTAKEPSKIDPIPLKIALDGRSDERFIVEAEFELTSAFKRFFGLDNLETGEHQLAFSLLRPDILLVANPEGPELEVLPNGQVIQRPAGDYRQGLRVVDVKLTSEPSAAYFAETVLYSMALSSWLQDTGRSDRFFVRADPSVWPGSYESSPILRASDFAKRAGRVATFSELLSALDEEVEKAPVEVFVSRFMQVLKSTLPRVLDAAPQWRLLPWEVTARCRNCDYLGMKWGAGPPPSDDLCIPTAKTLDHLSRVAYIPRGAFRKLREGSVDQVCKLAATSLDHDAFTKHPQLRATKGIVKGRASSLLTGYSGVAAGSPSSATLPAWPEARVYIIAEFDPSSAITVAFAFNATWWERDDDNKANQQRESQRLLVTDRSLNTERDVFITFLEAIDQQLERIKKELGDPSFQIYIWDSVTFEHLTRLVGRHLDTILARKSIRHLAWLFPPTELIANPELIHRGSAIAIVSDAIRTSLAAPIPHVYSLLSVARSYHLSHVQNPDAMFRIDAFYEDPLTSQVPIERVHEFWHPTMRAKNLSKMSAAWESVLTVKLRALEHIVIRITADLRAELIARAPKMSDIKPPAAKQSMAADAQLVYAFAEFNNALTAQENVRLRSLQADEREATFGSAKLLGVHPDSETVLALFGLQPQPNRFVFHLSDGSTEVKAKPGDFTFALSDPNKLWFLEKSLGSLAGELMPNPRIIPRFAKDSWRNFPLIQVLTVAIAAIDRHKHIVVLDFNETWWPIIEWLIAGGMWSFEKTLMLDPVHRDFYLKKLEKCLKSIGVCPIALPANGASPIGSFRGALKANRSENSPVAEVLWGARELETRPVLGRTEEIFPKAIVDKLGLNEKQYNAVLHSFLYRFTLIWGPPGTGKTHTLTAIIIALLSAELPVKLRVLVSAQTYGAIDEVLRKLAPVLASGEMLNGVSVLRIRSQAADRNSIEKVADLQLNIDGMREPSQGAIELVHNLTTKNGSIIVFAPPQQVFKLSEIADKDLDARLFDVIILDEAGQLDFGNGALALRPLAENGTVVVAGDPLQLPPIRQAIAPDAYKTLLGSLYTYFQKRLQTTECRLSVSYRSNEIVLAAVKQAGYPELQSHSAKLRFRMTHAMNDSVDFIDKIVEPNAPCTVLIYDDGEHAQANPIEVEIIGKIVERIRNRALFGLEGELDRFGNLAELSCEKFNDISFWSKGIGIVTPHRAQQAMLISDLQARFESSPQNHIREAVDTVERFQGQQRDIILISFALGDTDAIATEEEFLLSLNRFNVMISRARAKVVVVVSRQVLDHLSDDIAVLNESRLLKWFGDQYCNQSEALTESISGRSIKFELRQRWFDTDKS